MTLVFRITHQSRIPAFRTLPTLPHKHHTLPFLQTLQGSSTGSAMADSKHFLTCFICGTFEIENKKLAAFGVTFERFSEWKDKVKGLKIGSKLCQVHFDSEDIIKGKYIFNQFYPLKVYRLSKDAIPKHFLSNCAEIFSFDYWSLILITCVIHNAGTNKSGDKKTRTFFPEKNVSSTEIGNNQPLLVHVFTSKFSCNGLCK